MRPSQHVRTSVAAALVAGAAVGLSGCGMLGGDEEPAASGSTTAPAPASSTPAATESGSEAPAGSATESTPAESSATEGSESQDAAGKPAKTDVVAGLKKYYARTDKTGVVDHDKLANCIADNGYGRLSAKTLNAMKDGDPSKVDGGDRASFTGIALACAPKSMKSGAPSLPTNLPTGIPTTMPTG